MKVTHVHNDSRAAVSGCRLIGPYFFDGNVICGTYLQMLRTFVMSLLDNILLAQLSNP
jgi:hypothetical protein